MKVEDFILMFLEKGGVLRDQNIHLGLDWEQWRQLANFVSNFEFKCGSEGDIKKCSGTFSATESGCCAECLKHIGYLGILPKNVMMLREIASRFDPEKGGFWRDEPDLRTGNQCTLPYGWRSPTCLSFYCKNNLTPLEDSFLDLLGGKINWNNFVIQVMSRGLQAKRQNNQARGVDRIRNDEKFKGHLENFENNQVEEGKS